MTESLYAQRKSGHGQRSKWMIDFPVTWRERLLVKAVLFTGRWPRLLGRLHVWLWLRMLRRMREHEEET